MPHLGGAVAKALIKKPQSPFFASSKLGEQNSNVGEIHSEVGEFKIRSNPIIITIVKQHTTFQVAWFAQ